MSAKKPDLEFIKSEIFEIIKLAKNWNLAQKSRDSAIPQTIVDRLVAIKGALE